MPSIAASEDRSASLSANGWIRTVTSLRGRLANCPPILTPFVMLTAATLLLCSTGLDTGISARFYGGGGKWPLSDVQPWKAMYDFGELPALFLGIGGLVVVIGALVIPHLRSWRKAGCFLALALALGPGLTVNGILKPYWGRPRPAQTAMFGGSSSYAPVWSPGRESVGRSFPSGHASMGFFLMVPGFLLYRRNRRLAVLLFAVGLTAGGVVGLARIVQGRHFASDVLWSAACVYYAALFAFMLLRLDLAGVARTEAGGDPSAVFRLPDSTTEDEYREAA